MPKVFIISEIGLNHNGDFSRAQRQIEYSKECGADAVKFQYYNPRKILSVRSPYFHYVCSAMFSRFQIEELKRFSDLVGIEFMCSVFSVQLIPWVSKLVKRHKVASRMLDNINFIKALIATNKPVIQSVPHDKPFAIFPVNYMVCISKYPTLSEETDEALEFQKTWQYGWSNHCPSLEPAQEAVENGARFIEAHTTISRTMSGCDQQSSWDYYEFKKFISWVREQEECLV